MTDSCDGYLTDMQSTTYGETPPITSIEAKLAQNSVIVNLSGV